MEEWWEDTPGELLEVGLPLHRFAYLMGHDLFAFWGIRVPDRQLPACETYWTCSERLTLAKALYQAEAMIAEELGFPPYPTVCREEVSSETGLCSGCEVVKLKFGLLQGVGVPEEEEIGTYPLAYGEVGGDVVLIVPAYDGELANLRFYEADTSRRLYPSRMVRQDDGSVVVTFPWYNLKRFDKLCELVQVDDMASFVQEVDVKRFQLKPPGITLISIDSCEVAGYSACAEVLDSRMGIVCVRPAVYDEENDSWSLCCLPRSVQRLRLTYLAGEKQPFSDLVVLWLAVSLLPSPPCGCEKVRLFWEENLKPAPVFSDLEKVPPWGGSAGAWKAWQIVQRYSLGRGGTL